MSRKTPLTDLKGLGPKRAAVLEEAGIGSVEDLFGYFPRRYLDRRTVRRIAELRSGEACTVVGMVVRAKAEGRSRGRMRFRAVLADGTGFLELIWFQGVRYFSETVVPGEQLAVYGRVGFFGVRAQMQHPDFELLGRDERGGDSDFERFHTGRIIPIYPTNAAMKQSGLHSRKLRVLIAQAFAQFFPRHDENLPEPLVRRHALLPLDCAYREIHFPSSEQWLDAARRRMKWTELFYLQLLFALKRARLGRARSVFRVTHSGRFTRRLYSVLPFELTGSQKQVIREIYADLRASRPMNRLLQGDVGSGKTLVAVFAITLAADNGFQAAFMAPTEILAVQHYLGLRRLLEPLGIGVVLLAGRQSKKERASALEGLSDGKSTVAVGTHAMIEKQVSFSRLGLVVIDEQHRFGVLQRKALQEKSEAPHVLLMTATPIPRTLTMAGFGDLDLSVINTLPAGRVPVKTVLAPERERERVYDLLRRELRSGRQGYIVYPLVEESEKVDLRAAVDEYDRLSTDVFSDLRVGLIHGQMSPEEKASVMERFRSRALDLLVGTTVIEVGVDVPNASVMVIEHAERFGLAQLHQLRGRVGRGRYASVCFLIHAALAGESADRLQAMVSTCDGFRIAELDAKIRGVGNVLGLEQSGMVSGLKLADPLLDGSLMYSARQAAFALIADDPDLRRPEHAMVRRWYLRHYQERCSLVDIG